MSTVLNPAPARSPADAASRLPVADHDDRTRRHSGEIRKLTSLLDVSLALGSPVNLKSAFHRVLEMLERYPQTSRGDRASPRPGRRLFYKNHWHPNPARRGPARRFASTAGLRQRRPWSAEPARSDARDLVARTARPSGSRSVGSSDDKN